jgi:hypothetical protein
MISANDPFGGSPAEDYAVGEAGLDFPRPKAMNGLSADEMGRAFIRVRKMFAAADLDPDTVFRGRPDALAKVLEPGQRRHLLGKLNSRDQRKSTRGWLTGFAPKTADQTGDVIKVRGTTRLRKVTGNGLRGVMVTLDHDIVYAMHRPGNPGSVIRVIVRRTSEVFVYRTSSGVKVWLQRSDRSATPARCDESDGFIHPVYDDETPAGPEPSGPPIDPYDLTRQRPKEGAAMPPSGRSDSRRSRPPDIPGRLGPSAR